MERTTTGPALGEAARERAGRYYGLAVGMARRSAGRNRWLFDELLDHATLGLMDAAARWTREDRGFGPYARQAITWRIVHFYRKRARRLRILAPAEADLDALPSSDVEPDAAAEAAELLATLPGELAEALRVRYLEGRSLDAAAAALGLSRRAFRDRLEDALSRCGAAG